MNKLTTEEFKEKIFDFENETEWNFKGTMPTILDFYADWCRPCQALGPILEDIQKEYEGKINIFKIDTENEHILSEIFQIRSIPSMLFIPLNESPQMTNGLLPKDKIKEIIKSVLKID